MNWLSNPRPLWQQGYSFLRMFVGVTLIYHGVEVFNAGQIEGYGKWLNDLHFPVPLAAAYLGKGSEFVGGILLALGLLTRPTCIVLTLTFIGIAFFMGHGKILTEDQHPFLYVILSLIYLFNGPGKLSLDNYLLTKKS